MASSISCLTSLLFLNLSDRVESFPTWYLLSVVSASGTTRNKVAPPSAHVRTCFLSLALHISTLSGPRWWLNEHPKWHRLWQPESQTYVKWMGRGCWKEYLICLFSEVKVRDLVETSRWPSIWFFILKCFFPDSVADSSSKHLLLMNYAAYLKTNNQGVQWLLSVL